MVKSNANIQENSLANYFRLVHKTVKLLPPKQKMVFRLLIPAATLLSLFDFVGVILLASLGTMAFKSISGDQKPTRVELIINDLSNQTLNSTQLSILFLAFAIIALVSKTIMTALFSFKLTRWLATVDSQLSDLANKSLLVLSSEKVRKLSPGNALNLVVNSGTRLTTGAIQASMNLIVDSISICVLGSLLFIANPVTATLNFFILLTTGLIIRNYVNSKVNRLGSNMFALQTSINDIVVSSVLAYKEIRIYGMQNEIRKEFVESKFSLSWLSLKSSFLNSFFRYFLEIAILFSAIFVFFAEYALSDLRRAITSLILFLAAGLRLVPSIQRVQSSFLNIRLTQGMTREYFSLTANNNLSESVPDYSSRVRVRSAPSILSTHLSFVSNVDDSQFPILRNINVSLPAGSIIGILGESGSGKTTFLDAVAGLITPSSGSITFSTAESTFNPKEVRIGYCTQHPIILKESLLSNITPPGIKPDLKEIYRFLNTFGLSDLLNDEIWKMRRDSLSGGEKLRISFIRSICTNTAITLFDEPSSSLDDRNTQKIVKILQEFKNKRTQVVATHDNRIIEVCDVLVKIEKGTIKYLKDKDSYFKDRGD